MVVAVLCCVFGLLLVAAIVAAAVRSATASPDSRYRHGRPFDFVATTLTAGRVMPATAVEGTGPLNGTGPVTLAGPLNQRQLRRVDEALRIADASTGLTFAVYLGGLGAAPRAAALDRHGALPEASRSVLIAVSPNEQALEIVAGDLARLPRLTCRFAEMSMRSAFAGGDIAGGVVAGLSQLAERAR